MNKTQELMKRIEVYFPSASKGELLHASAYGKLLCAAYHELKRLNAIIEKLPKTADDVPVIPEIDFVYHPDDCWEGANVQLAARTIHKRYDKKGQNKYGQWKCLPTHYTEWVEAGVHQCYSTFDAAIKSKAEECK